MSDNITLPRELVERARKALTPMAYDTWPRERNEVVEALRTALAAPRLEVTVDPRLTPAEAAAISSALAAPEPEPEKRHPGYVIGNHWLETAYERLCAGEAEDAILEDCGWERVGDAQALRRDAERYKWVLGWLVRSGLLSCEACRIDTPESYGNWWILRKPSSIDGVAFVAYGSDLRDAIDAAMKEDGT